MALLDTFVREVDVMMHADGPLKMEDKDEHTQNSVSSYDYKCFTKEIPQGFFQLQYSLVYVLLVYVGLTILKGLTFSKQQLEIDPFLGL